MKAIIQAGGKGTRLQPVTLEIPKPLLTVKHKPILSHLVDFFGGHGFNDVTVVISKNHADDYAWWKKRYSKELPRGLKFVVEPEALGTFGGLKVLRSKLKKPFILSNGDELKSFDLKALIADHQENTDRPLATIALVEVPNASDYGVPVMKGRKIMEFLEKPVNPPANFVSSGIYILDPKVFEYADFSKGFLMREKDIFPKLAADGKLAGYKVKNYRWYPTDTIEKWERAIKEW